MKPVATGASSVPRVKQILVMEYPEDSLLLGPNRPGRSSSSSFITSERSGLAKAKGLKGLLLG